MIRTFKAARAMRGIACGASLLLAHPVLAAGPVPRSTETRGALSISTDPVGASVYIDGRLSGLTPLSLDRLSPGDHRVRVIKDGYLENTRLITVRSQQPHALTLKLTRRVTAPNDTSASVATQINRGGGTASDPTSAGLLHNPLFLVSFAGVGAGAAAALLRNNVPPQPGVFSMSPPESPAIVGMAGITEYTFTASGAIDYDDDPLIYSWNFGDGRADTGATVRHTFTTAGTYTATLTVSDGEHAIPAGSKLIPVRPALTGTWGNALDPIFSCPFTLTLVQTGRSLAGSILFSGACSGSAVLQSGTTSGSTYPTTVTWQTSPFALTHTGGVQTGLTLSYQGTANLSGTAINGPLSETQPGTFTPPATTNFVKQ